jgi:hypothetical protein
MTSDSPFINNDTPPQLDLPRLGIIHLLAWTAAVAVAFLPHRLPQESFPRPPTRKPTAARQSSTEMVSVVNGILQGNCLFVTTSLYYWKKRGRQFRRQPGQILALQGTAFWAVGVVAQAIISLAGIGPGWSGFWVVFPYLILGLVFFVWFLRIAKRRGASIRWRWAFGVLALAPVLAWVLSMVGMFANRPFNKSPSISWLAIPQVAAAAVQFFALALAMVHDWRSDRQRHWTHWIGAGSRLFEAAAMIAMYVFMALLL